MLPSSRRAAGTKCPAPCLAVRAPVKSSAQLIPILLRASDTFGSGNVLRTLEALNAAAPHLPKLSLSSAHLTLHLMSTSF